MDESVRVAAERLYANLRRQVDGPEGPYVEAENGKLTAIMLDGRFDLYELAAAVIQVSTGF